MRSMATSAVEAQRLATDFQFRVLDEVSVEYRFSTPSHWRVEANHRFAAAIRDSEYGANRTLRHAASVYMTEPEVATVAVLWGDSLTLDEQGVAITSDRGATKSTMALRQVISGSVYQINHVVLSGPGSERIDKRFDDLVGERLSVDPALRLSREPGFQIAVGAPKNDPLVQLYETNYPLIYEGLSIYTRSNLHK
ncbi:hypothetical protein ACJ41O_000089 [Fusarium nematophilum]